MFRAKNVFISCLSISLAAASIGTARAEDNAVLFKIHDIVPVKNADGNVTSCEFGATFYNRMESELSNASVNLTWHDEVVADTIEQEDRATKEASRLNRTRSVGRYNTASYNEKDISLALKLPPLKPKQQVTLKSKVASDRCFLLLGDVDLSVSNCGTASAGNNIGIAKNTGSCDNLFRFVSSQNAEYYSEFQAISLDEKKVIETSQMEQQRKDIESAFNAANDELNKLTQTFAGPGQPILPAN